MIQRIQSLWLLLAVIAGALTFKFPFCTGTWAKDGNTAIPQMLAHTPSILVLGVSIVTLVLAFLTIFLFKNRRQQLFVAILALLASLGLIYTYWNERNAYLINTHLSLSSIYTFAMPVFLFIAVRGISRDIRLVKRADRLR
jgi:uncharacterized membrane protein